MKAARIERAWRWVTGGPKKRPPAMPGLIQFHYSPAGWEMRFSAAGPGFVVSHERAPNFFNRALQKLLLGIHWEML